MSVILAKDFWSVKGAFLTESTRVLLCITMFSFSWSLPALGCADPKPPRHGKVRRHGDKAIITCNDTSIMWKLTCQNSAWVGAAKNCSQGERYFLSTSRTVQGCTRIQCAYSLVLFDITYQYVYCPFSVYMYNKIQSIYIETSIIRSM